MGYGESFRIEWFVFQLEPGKHPKKSLFVVK